MNTSVRICALLLTLVITLLTFTSCKEKYIYDGKYTAVNFNAWIDYIDSEDRGEWGRRADLMQEFMYSRMLGPSDTFDNVYPLTNPADNNQFHYWVQAQIVDSTVDAYIRTGDKAYAQKAKDLIFAVKKRNGNHLTNDFFDDMGWMACAMAKLYRYTEDEELMPDLLLLYEVIMDSWNDVAGGIAWSRNTLYYRNSPANGPACILACRLYNITGDQKYLDMALKIFDWWDNTLVDHESGLVWDGINRELDNRIDKGWRFTYCQGVYIGSCVELAEITGDSSYIDKAVKTADYVVKHMNRDGVLQSEGDGDGGAFKGILCRYFVELISATDTNRETYVKCLEDNAKKMWNNIPSEEEPVCNASWNDPGKTPVSLHILSSGLALLESVATLQIYGFIG